MSWSHCNGGVSPPVKVEKLNVVATFLIAQVIGEPRENTEALNVHACL